MNHSVVSLVRFRGSIGLDEFARLGDFSMDTVEEEMHVVSRFLGNTFGPALRSAVALSSTRSLVTRARKKPARSRLEAGSSRRLEAIGSSHLLDFGFF